MAKRRKKSRKKSNFVTIGQYKVSKDKKTKYIDLGCGKKAPKEIKQLIKKLEEMFGGVLFISLFDADFKDEHDIPDFVKGSISVNLDNASDDEDDDEEDEDYDEEDDDEEDEEPKKKRRKKTKSKSKKKSRKKVDDEEDDADDEEDDDDEIPY